MATHASRRKPARVALSALALSAAALVGCNNAGEGALTGAGLGALGGLAIGSLTGNAGAGAAIGAISGGIGGAVIGDQNERNARDPYGRSSRVYDRGYEEGYRDANRQGYYDDRSYRRRPY